MGGIFFFFLKKVSWTLTLPFSITSTIMATEPKAKVATGLSKIPYWRMIFDRKVVTDEIIKFPYDGSGTKDDPYVVSWIPGDPRNPMNFSSLTKWWLTGIIAVITLAASVASSAYAGSLQQIITTFDVDREVVILGISVFVLGFAFGPLIWAPLSETSGRRYVFIATYICLTAFNAGATGSQNIWTLIILRFLAGFFGSSPFGNSGGAISDLFPASHRGLAMGTFSAAAFMGPALGMFIPFLRTRRAKEGLHTDLMFNRSDCGWFSCGGSRVALGRRPDGGVFGVYSDSCVCLSTGNLRPCAVATAGREAV